MDKRRHGRTMMDLVDENALDIAEHEEIIEIPIEAIEANPDQPRTTFDKTALKQLSESIKAHGIIQPIIVKPSNQGYILVAGERRVRAAHLAGKKTVPAVVRDYNAIYLTELSILENVQREDLTPIEEAVAYEKAIKNLGLTQGELARKIGKSRSYVTNIIGLLTLPKSVINDVNQGLISMGHARVLSKLDDEARIVELAERIKREQLSVRKIETLAAKRPNRSKKTNQVIDQVHQDTFEQRFKHEFGEHVRVNVSGKTLKIQFKDAAHLAQVAAKLKE